MKKEVNIFNNAVDNILCAKTKAEPFNAESITNLNNWNNSPAFKITAKSTMV